MFEFGYLTFEEGVINTGWRDDACELTPKAAVDLASELLRWASQNVGK